MDYFDTGFCVRKPSWHAKEVLLEDAPETWDEARAAASLTWEPEERPSFITRYPKEFILCRACDARVGKTHDNDCPIAEGTSRRKVEVEDAAPEGSVFDPHGKFVFVPDPDHKQIVRNDTFEMLNFGASSDFSLIYHGSKTGGSSSMEAIIEMFVGLGVKFDTTGSAKKGGLVWAVMYLDEPFEIPGDPNGLSLPYRALLNSHNGEGACKLVDTEVRVVCANTWQMASVYGDQTGRQLVFRHTGDTATKIEEALQSISDLREEVKQYQAMAAVMQEVHVSQRQLEKFTKEFIPSPAENGEQISERVRANIDSARGQFHHILDASPTTEGIEETMYGVVQAATEYLDHSRAYRSGDTYMGRTILKAEPLKARTIGIAASIFHDGLAKVSDPWAEQLKELGDREKARSLAARPMTLSR